MPVLPSSMPSITRKTTNSPMPCVTARRRVG
jgi:hypothetical protein